MSSIFRSNSSDMNTIFILYKCLFSATLLCVSINLSYLYMKIKKNKLNIIFLNRTLKIFNSQLQAFI